MNQQTETTSDGAHSDDRSAPVRVAEPRRAAPATLTAAIVAIVLIAAIDWLAGPDLGFSVFYAVPIYLSALSAGRLVGAVVAVSAVVAWAAVAAASNPGLRPFVLAWNTSVRACFFGVVVALAWSRRMLSRSEERARTDVLTGVRNRRGFLEEIAREVGRAERSASALTILFLDCDNFKKLNDTLGHAAGDEVLAVIGAELRRHTRGIDIVARIGGDEFAVVLVALPPESAETVVRRLYQALSSAVERVAPIVSLSGGALTWIGQPPAAAELLHLADQLMYDAKQRGRGRLVHNTRQSA